MRRVERKPAALFKAVGCTAILMCQIQTFQLGSFNRCKGLGKATLMCLSARASRYRRLSTAISICVSPGTSSYKRLSAAILMCIQVQTFRHELEKNKSCARPDTATKHQPPFVLNQHLGRPTRDHCQIMWQASTNRHPELLNVLNQWTTKVHVRG